MELSIGSCILFGCFVFLLFFYFIEKKKYYPKSKARLVVNFSTVGARGASPMVGVKALSIQNSFQSIHSRHQKRRRN